MNNNTSSDYEKLLADYRELQLRVTRFSSVEQELINTRDRLDNELVLYKKLNHFIKDAFKDLSEKKFLQLACETIVDIFELESSVIFLKDNNNQLHSHFFTEGIHFSEEQQKKFAIEIEELGNDLDQEKSIILEATKLNAFPAFKLISRGLYYHFIDTELQIQVYLLGLISKEYDPVYQVLKNRHETIFSLFAQQAQSLLSNIRKNDKITNQIKIISQSEDELRKLSQIATKTKNGVVISDEFGKIIWVNEAFENITGYLLEEVKGKQPKVFLQGKDSDQDALQKLKIALQKKEYIEVSLINYKKNGEKYYNELQITPVFDENGKHQNFIALQRDITDEIRSKNELLNVNSRFELISEKSHIGIWERNYKTGKTTYNKILLEQYGVEGTQYEHDFFTHWKLFFEPNEVERIENNLTDFIYSEIELFEDEFKIIHWKTKEVITLRILIIAERDKNNNPIKLIGTSIDITEKKKHEITIQEHLKQQELLADISLQLNNITDFKNRIDSIIKKLLLHTNSSRVYIFENIDNDNACSNTFEVCNKGIEPQINELLYVPYEIIPYWKTTLVEKGMIYSDNIEQLPDDVRAVLEPQQIKSIIVFPLIVKGDFFGFIGFDECVVYKKWTKSELELLRAVSGIIANAYERDVSEKNLIASENKYRSIIDNMNLGLIETNLEGKTIYTNKKFYELNLLEDSSLMAVNQNAEELLKRRLKDKVISSYNKLDENSFEIDYRRKDGIKKTFLLSYGNSTDQAGKLSGYINVFLDITTVKTLQKNLENALKERDSFLAKSTSLKNFYENVLNSSPSQVIVLNPELVVTYSNQHLHSEDTIWENAIGKSLQELSKINSVKDNHIIALIDKIQQAVSNKKLIQLEEKFNRTDGSEKYILQSILPIYNHHNTLENIIISGNDITELKKFEKNILQKNEELKKINSELDNFVYSVSHDLRSPLLSIKGVLELILKSNVLDQKTTNYINIAQTSTLRLDSTIQEILTYSKNARFDLQLEDFDIKKTVELIFDDLKFSESKQILTEIYIEGSSIIHSDKARLNIVLRNLIGNSFKYKRENTDNSFVKFTLTTDRDNIKIQVIDNGMGISERSIEKVFDMFYRGTKMSVGTGLGLYICKEIITKLKGNISVQSKVDVGTTFTVIIPKI